MARRQVLRVTGVEMRVRLHDVEANLQCAASLIRACSQKQQQQRTDVFLLPELAVGGYPVEEGDVFLRGDAREAEERALRFFQALARDVDAAIAYGVAREFDDKTFRLSTSVVGPDGLVAAYDKINLSAAEARVFEAGAQLPVVFPWRDFRVGLAVCKDLRLPELWRDLRAADVVLHACCFERDDTFHTWHTFVETRAVENQFYVLSLNHAGPAFGASLAAPPWTGPLDDHFHRPLVAPTDYDIADGGYLLHLDVHRGLLDTVRRKYPYADDAANYAKLRRRAFSQSAPAR